MKNTLLKVENLSISFEQYGRGLRKFISTPIKDLNIEIKLNELTEINLKDRKIYIEETENHDDENDRVDNRKYEKLDENMEDDFLESED